MECSSCGTKNPKRNKFCKECGEELPLAPKPKAAPPASPAPTVVVIQEEKRRRGVPGVIWMLLGMILVVVLCCLLVWLDVVDVPQQVRARLPDQVVDIVDAVDDARPPGAPDGDRDGGVVQQPARPPGNQPGPQPPSACEEDINFIVGGDQYDAPIPFSREAIGRFRSIEPFEYDEYDLYITQYGETVGPIPCATRPYENRYEIYTEEYIQFDGGEWMTLTFKPRGEDCEVGREQIMVNCDSGSLYRDGWPYNNSCCTHGCWCDDGSGNMGCWQNCAPQCVE